MVPRSHQDSKSVTAPPQIPSGRNQRSAMMRTPRRRAPRGVQADQHGPLGHSPRAQVRDLDRCARGRRGRRGQAGRQGSCGSRRAGAARSRPSAAGSPARRGRSPREEEPQSGSLRRRSRSPSHMMRRDVHVRDHLRDGPAAAAVRAVQVAVAEAAQCLLQPGHGGVSLRRAASTPAGSGTGASPVSVVIGSVLGCHTHSCRTRCAGRPRAAEVARPVQTRSPLVSGAGPPCA